MAWFIIPPNGNMLKGLIFINVGKSASTSVSSLFRKPTQKLGGYSGQCHRPVTFFKEHYKNEFDNYHKFAIVRNPYDRFVSHFLFRRLKFVGKDSDWFKERMDIIINYERGKMWRGTPVEDNFISEMISDENGKIIVDQLIKYENLKQEIKKLIKTFNIPFINPTHIDRLKLQETKEKEDWVLYYDNELQDIVDKYYVRDIELWRSL